MKKAEIISESVAQSGYSASVVREVLDAVVAATKAAVRRGEDVFLFGLGKLEVSARGVKRARNPHTGETVMVPPRKVVLFRASTSLLASANGAA